MEREPLYALRSYQLALSAILLAVLVGMVIWEATAFPQSPWQAVGAIILGLAVSGVHQLVTIAIEFETNVPASHERFIGYGWAMVILFIVATLATLIIRGHQAVTG